MSLHIVLLIFICSVLCKQRKKTNIVYVLIVFKYKSIRETTLMLFLNSISFFMSNNKERVR